MFKKRKWIIISVLAAAIVVAVGVMGGAAYAKSNIAAVTVQTDPQKVLADKVADILGLPTADVEAAFAKAQKEINTERAAERLTAEKARIDKLVADGKMTAEQADKMKTWLESKPDVSVSGFGQNGGFGRANCGPGGPGGFGPAKGGPGGPRGFGRGLPPADNASAPATLTTPTD
jgi:hypothetical protein